MKGSKSSMSLKRTARRHPRLISRSKDVSASFGRGGRLSPACIGSSLLLLICWLDQAVATEAIAECIRSGGLSEAESNINLLDLVSTPAAADWDASFAVKCINL